MTMDIRNPDFIRFCQTADYLEVMNRLTGNNIRGLDKIAINSLSARGKLSPEVKNMLLGYFYSEFANTVYHRSDLGRIHDYWVAQKVKTIQEAEKMFHVDIHQLLKKK